MLRPSRQTFAGIAFVIIIGASLAGAPASAQSDPPPAELGQIAFVSDASGAASLSLMLADGTNQRRVIDHAPDDSPTWSPEGSRIAFVTLTESGARELAVIEVATGAASILTSLGGTISHPVWSPDGDRIAFAAALNGPADIYTIRPNGTDPVNVTAHQADDRWPSWSPDGTRLAFQSDRDGTPDIYTVGADSSDLQRLTSDPGSDRAPVWSPEGMRIAFVSNRDGNDNIFVIDFNGTNLVRLSDTPGDDSSPSWSPDGVSVAFAGALSPDITELFTINANGIDRQQLTIDEARVTNPDWSPDGGWIVYASNRGGSFDLYALATDGPQWSALTNDPARDMTHPVWSATLPPSIQPIPPAAPTESAVLSTSTPADADLLPIPTATAALEPLPTATPQVILTPTPYPTVTPLSTTTPIPPPSPVPVFDITLTYDASIPSIYLTNTAGRRINLAGLSFTGNGRTVDASIWTRSSLSADLFDFPSGGCLGLWSLGLTMQAPPPECVTRHGWWASNNVVFWTAGQFTVANNGTPIAVCNSADGVCVANLDGPPVNVPSSPPPTESAPPASGQNADLLLVYDAGLPSFYLVNTSGRRLDLSILRFEGEGRSVSPGVWANVMTGTIYDFGTGDCLGLWGYGVAVQPAPSECETRQGWFESNAWIFWRGGSFNVTANGALIATCESSAGRCFVQFR